MFYLYLLPAPQNPLKTALFSGGPRSRHRAPARKRAAPPSKTIFGGIHHSDPNESRLKPSLCSRSDPVNNTRVPDLIASRCIARAEEHGCFELIASHIIKYPHHPYCYGYLKMDTSNRHKYPSKSWKQVKTPGMSLLSPSLSSTVMKDLTGNKTHHFTHACVPLSHMRSILIRVFCRDDETSAP